MTAPATSRVNITDRAHRYRANKLAPAGRKECARCGSTRFLVPDHKDGYPDHTTRSNLQWLCKSCNTKKGLEFARMGKGRLTNQYNPAKGVPTFDQYAWAVSQQNHSGEHGDAGAIIHATPKKLRQEYAREINARAGKTRRARDDERWNPADTKAFHDFHGYEPSETVKIPKTRHYDSELAAAGELKFLEVWGVDNRGHKIKGFGKDCFLSFNGAEVDKRGNREDPNQLYIEGGDQSINLEDYGIKNPHRLETLGRITDIGYFTNKTHLGDEGGEAVYVHKFRSTNENGKHVIVRIARYPDLIYDVKNEWLLFSGGSYEILREGIDK